MKFNIPLFFVGLLISTMALSWNSSGHQIVAAMTWDMMSEKQRTYWVDVLKHHPRFQKDFINNKPKDVKTNPEYEPEWIFRQASIWPDVVRGIPKTQMNIFHHASWHYVNIPIYLDTEINTDHINTDKDFHGSFHNGINVMQATGGHINTLRKPGVSKKHQAFALSWLLHLVADSHQPLHCSSLVSEKYFPNGDRGGNDIPIMGQGQIENLHWFWDSALHQSTSFKIIERKAELIQETLVSLANSHKTSTPPQWVNDCYQLARAKTYTPLLMKKFMEAEKREIPIPKVFISEVYAQQARKVSEKQALKAALELKAILDQVDLN